MLSLKKLENLFLKKGYLIREIFSIGDICVYVSLVNMNTSDFFLVYIPSKYTIRVENKHKVYKLKEIDVNYLKTKSEVDCAEERDDLRLELNYNEVETKHDFVDKNGGKLFDSLDEKYNRPIILKNDDDLNEAEIRNMYRQINRLKYCVMSIKIKIALTYRNYMVVVKRDNSVVCYRTKHYTVFDNLRRLLMVIDLESFHKKFLGIQEDIASVKNGIHRVLNKNQTENILNISRLLSGKSDFEKFLESIKRRSGEYDRYIDKFTQILSASNERERNIANKLRELRNRGQVSGIQGVHHDTQILHQISASESELKNILDVKQETMKCIEELDTNRNDFLLFIDKVLYDNAIMVDSIVKNLEMVKNYLL